MYRLLVNSFYSSPKWLPCTYPARFCLCVCARARFWFPSFTFDIVVALFSYWKVLCSIVQAMRCIKNTNDNTNTTGNRLKVVSTAIHSIRNSRCTDGIVYTSLCIQINTHTLQSKKKRAYTIAFGVQTNKNRNSEKSNPNIIWLLLVLSFNLFFLPAYLLIGVIACSFHRCVCIQSACDRVSLGFWKNWKKKYSELCNID